MLSLVGVGTFVTSFSVGAVVSIVKEVTDWVIGLLALSVTVMVQLSYVPSFNGVELSGCVRVTVLLSPDDADDEDELPQAPPYVMVPASFEEKV